jgi:recombination protein RecR
LNGLKKFEKLVEALQSLPTIGKKSALKLAFDMVVENSFNGLKIAHLIENTLLSIKKCKICGGISEDDICMICANESREKILCLVENPKDILVIEESGAYKGKYFVLENKENETIEKLKKIIADNEIGEIIFAFTPSIASDALVLFLEDKLKELNIKFSQIAQGIPTGVNLENVDFISLSKAINFRIKV